MKVVVLLALLVLLPATGAALQRDELRWTPPPETFGHWSMSALGEPPQEVVLLNYAGEEWLTPLIGAAEHLNANQGWFRFIIYTGLPVVSCGALDIPNLAPGTFAICEEGAWDDFGGMFIAEETSWDEHEHISHGYIGIDHDEYDNDPWTATGRRMSSLRHELLHVMGLDHSRGQLVGTALDGSPLYDGQTCVWSVREWGPNPSPPAQCPGSWDIVRLDQLYAHSHAE